MPQVARSCSIHPQVLAGTYAQPLLRLLCRASFQMLRDCNFALNCTLDRVGWIKVQGGKSKCIFEIHIYFACCL